MAEQIEAERKYTLHPGQGLPSLGGVVTEGPVAEFDLIATYYDAPDLRLTRAKQVIRRRLGGHDEGWHLKLPGDAPDQRFEVQAPLGTARVPQELRDRVVDTLAGAPLVPVALLRTHRREQRLLDADGAVVAVSCVDQVRAEVGETYEEWRETEVELVTGEPGLLDAIEAVLTEAGIRPAETGSKIARALGKAMGTVAGHRLDSDSAAGEVVLAYLADQVGVLQNREADVLVDGYDAVHRSRVATRRLRSTMRTYAGVFGKGVVKPLRAELRWHAEELGAPRDAEVLAERLLAAVGELPDSSRRLVWERVEAALNASHDAAHAELISSMRTARYELLQLALERLLVRPNLSERATEPARVVLPPMLARAIAKVRKLAAHAAARPSDLTRWHEVRKAAKAARYGAELLVPVLGKRATCWAHDWEAVTEGLGAVQDAVVSQQVLGELSWQGVADGLPRLPFDDLRHDQDRLLRESLARGREALAKALDRSSDPDR